MSALIPIGHRVPGSIATLLILTTATVVLYLAGQEIPAAIVLGYLGSQVGKLTELLSVQAEARRSGYHTPITPKREPERDTTEPEIETDPPPARRRTRVEAVIPPPLPDAKRDPTPMTERILELAGGRRYAEARGLAHQYRRPDLVSRVDALERAEKAERRAEDDTNGRIRRRPQ